MQVRIFSAAREFLGFGALASIYNFMDISVDIRTSYEVGYLWIWILLIKVHDT